MDPASSAIAIFHEVYSISLFVYEVVKDAIDYESDKDTIRQKLEHEIFFLEAFDKFFLDQGSGGIIHDSNLPATYPNRVASILQHLRETLSVYSKLALKHYPPYQRLILGDEGSGKELPWKEFDKGSFKGKVKELGLRAWDWSLFDKKKLLEVVSRFKEWTGRLKEIMSFSMLIAVRFKDVKALEDFQKSDTAKRAGLDQVAQRQFLKRSKKIKEAAPLEGQLVESLRDVQGSTLRIMSLVTEAEPYGKSVAVEYKGYGMKHTASVGMQHNLLRVKTNIRTLATLLQNSAFVGENEDSIEASSAPVMHTFQCIGYIDEPENNRMAFVFQLPAIASSLESLQTLHAFIEELDPRCKPSSYIPLEQRFLLAHNLCITILNLHGSGWVHKSIRSTNIVLLPKDSTGSLDVSAAPPSRVIPYLTGFEFSRLAIASTEVMSDFDIERNLYRHPNRQGVPTKNFNKMHDLYALGVVLLEIGIWRTVTSKLKPVFEQAKRSGKIQSPESIKLNLVKIAREELAKEMGTRYMDAVVTCLVGGFGMQGSDPHQKELGLAFREQVIEVMADGLRL